MPPPAVEYASKAPKVLSEVQLYAKVFVKPEVRERWNTLLEGVDKKERLARYNQMARDALMGESEEVRKAVREAKDKAKKERDEALETERAMMQSKPANLYRTREMAAAVAGLPEAIAMFCNQVGPRSGWCFTVLAGGPDPNHPEGNIQTFTYHHGRTQAGASFGSTHPGVVRAALADLHAFCHLVTPYEERIMRVANPSTDISEKQRLYKSQQKDGVAGPVQGVTSQGLLDEGGERDALGLSTVQFAVNSIPSDLFQSIPEPQQADPQFPDGDWPPINGGELGDDGGELEDDGGHRLPPAHRVDEDLQAGDMLSGDKEGGGHRGEERDESQKRRQDEAVPDDNDAGLEERRPSRPKKTATRERPEWMDAAHEYLRRGPDVQAWRGAVEAWLAFEQGMTAATLTMQRLPAGSKRPEMLSKWIGAGKRYNVVPALDEQEREAFATAWLDWWKEMQPVARKYSHEDELPSPLQAKHNLSTIKKGGPSGLVLALVGLKWWYRPGLRLWDRAVEDLRACLEKMTSSNGDVEFEDSDDEEGDESGAESGDYAADDDIVPEVDSEFILQSQLAEDEVGGCDDELDPVPITIDWRAPVRIQLQSCCDGLFS
ncbi:hypothetical protein MD484_g8980, partial [Candolleomyces efflorescens]